LPEVPRYIHTGVRVVTRNEVYVSSQAEQLNERKLDNMMIHQFTPSGRVAVSSAYRACAGMWPLSPPDEGILCVSIEGEVFEFPRGGAPEHLIETQGEVVDSSDNGPNHLVVLTCVTQIGGVVYCAGAARHVYRRLPGRVWEAMDRGVFVPRQVRTEICGFFTLGGVDESEIYAAGFSGEIWTRRDGKWRREVSPTNMTLDAMAVRADGQVCIAGMAGVVVFGRSGRFRAIEQNASEDDFLAVTLFQDKFYLSNKDGVFRLDEASGDLEVVKTGGDGSTAYVDAGDGVIWSVGLKTISWSNDGEHWQAVPEIVPNPL
jgi:hypothetical protein